MNLLCAGNKVFVKNQAQGGVLTPTPPCVRPWSMHPPINPEHVAGQVASTVFQVVDMTRRKSNPA